MDETVSGGNTGGTGSAPLTFADAFQSAPVDSPSAEPATQDTTPPAAASPGSEQAASPQQPEERSGFIPRSRFDEVNTEKNTLKQQFEEYKQRNAWAENAHYREAVERIARSAGNPLALVAELVQELGPHPEFGPQLRSFLGQQFGNLRQRQAAAAEAPPEPDIAVYDQQGNVVSRTYSDTALAKRDAYFKQQLLQEISQQFAPKLQTLETIQKERDKAAADQQADHFSKSFVAEASALVPGFDIKVHGPAIAAELNKFNLPDDAHPAIVEAVGLKALLKVVLPTLNASAQSKLLDSLQQKAAASTAVNPSSAAPTSRSSPKSFHDTSLQW
jgi:hypothetical protein